MSRRVNEWDFAFNVDETCPRMENIISSSIFDLKENVLHPVFIVSRYRQYCYPIAR